MNYNNYSDSELLNLINEESEEAKSILLEKYRYIINLIVKKYKMPAKMLNIEYKDLYQEALLGYSDAINRFDDKSASLPTFITLCVSRRLQQVLKRAQTLNNKMFNESLSLEYEYDISHQPLRDILSDENKNNPLVNLELDENYSALIDEIHNSLSDSEYEVFSLLINHYNYKEIATILSKNPKQIDNTIQRVKTKIKDILNKR